MLNNRLEELLQEKARKQVLAEYCERVDEATFQLLPDKEGLSLWNYQTSDYEYYKFVDDSTSLLSVQKLDRYNFNELVAKEYDALVEDYQEEQLRLSRHASVYQTADRILTNSDVTCAFTHAEVSMPAFNDGKDITFNLDAIDTSDIHSDEFLTTLTGLNHHEVAHLLWTPRQGSELLQTVVSEQLLVAFNCLEDNRIESLMTKKYPSVIPMMMMSLRKHLLNEPDNPALFVLLGGRSYLPQELIDMTYARFASAVGDATAERTAQIISEYRVLVLPKQTQLALALIRELAELLDIRGNGEQPNNARYVREGGEGNEGGEGEFVLEGGEGQAEFKDFKQSDIGKLIKNHTCITRKPMKSGRPEAGSKQELIDKPSPIDINKIKSNSDEKGNPNPEAGDSGNEVDESQLINPDNEVKLNTDDDDLLKAFDSIVNKPQTQQAIQQELNRLRKNITNAGANSPLITKWNKRGKELVNSDMRAVAKQFADELIRAEIDCDPHWETEQSSGKLNIQRVMQGDVSDFDKVFDKWEFNDRGTDFEAVVLVDNSGSMGGQMYDTCQSAWVIKKALDSINSSSTIITFSTRSKRLYDANEKVSPTHFSYIGADSDTQALGGLQESHRIFSNSKRPNKVLFILTDGSWGDSQQSNAEILKLKELGVLVVLIGFRLGEPAVADWSNGDYTKRKLSPDSAEYQEYVHYADVYSNIDKLNKLPVIAKDIIKSHFLKLEVM